MDITPIDRPTYERTVTAPFKDQRCYGEYENFVATGQYYADTLSFRAAVARGAALAAEGYQPPTRTRTYAGPADGADEWMTGLTGRPSHAEPGECHYCGLDRSTCDCR